MRIIIPETEFVKQTKFYDLPIHTRIYIHRTGYQIYSSIGDMENFIKKKLKNYLDLVKENLPDWMIVAGWANNIDGRVLDVVEFRIDSIKWKKIRM